MLGYEDLHFSAEAEQTMGMPIATERYWTVEDVWALPVDPHHRYEAVDGELLVSAGQAVVTHRGEWVRYSTPGDDGAEYVAICLPAFSMDTVKRDE